MPWSDDTRCLYCDGKLPLFRKLAHGQFCSKAHQKKYWDEQQQLAVERLHQTHSDIRAYRPPEPIENILGPLVPETDFGFTETSAEPVVQPPHTEDAPAIAGFLAQAIDPVSGQLSPFVATGSLDFEPVALWPETPAWAAAGVAGANLRLRAAAEYLWDWAMRVAEPPRHEAAGYPALEPLPHAVQQPLHAYSLTEAPSAASSEIPPAVEEQFRIAGPLPLQSFAGMQASELTPIETSGNIARVRHGWTALPVGLRSSQDQFSIPQPAPRAAAIAPHTPDGWLMAAAAGALDFTLPALAARLQGPLFEVPSDYEPPLVETLRALGHPAAQAVDLRMQSVETLADHSHTAAGRPEISLSNRPVVSAAITQFSTPGLCSLAMSEPVSVPAILGAGVRNMERYAGETQQPVLEGIRVPASGLAPGKLQALDITPRALSAEPMDAAGPQALHPPTQAAVHPEPKLLGAPLAPNALPSLAHLPWRLQISQAVVDAVAVRALTPQVTASLPVASGASIVPVSIIPAQAEPIFEAPVEGPIDIPAQAGHVAMRISLTPARPVGLLAGRNVIPEPVQGQQLLPKLWMEPVPIEFAPAPAIEADIPEVPGAVIEAEAARRGGFAKVRDFWTNAPRDLKLLACAIPIVIALAFHQFPKVSLSAPENSGLPGGFRQVLNTQFASLKRTVTNRAAIALDEDFRGGIDHWVSRTGATAEWSFNATGFVQPGPLALYEPSLKMTDYQMQFLGMIDEKSMSWVARARDFENYYVIKLVVLKPGPVPTIGLTRYAVIDGKPVDRVDRPVPVNARPDTIYRVRMEVHGADYALEVQGQMVDSWSEPRLNQGGVGFFTGHGEKSSIRWVQLTHQYDVLGRLCAYLAPYEF